MVRKIKSTAATRLCGLDLSFNATAINISPMRGVASTSFAVAPASCYLTISFKVSRTTLNLRHSRKEQMAMLPIDALSFQLLPAARASNANITGAGIPSLSKTTSRGDGQQRDVQSFRNAITTSIGSNLLRTHWFMSHPLKNSHRLPIRSPIHFLFENNSRVRNLVSHSLILLRLTEPFSLLRLKLKPGSSKCTDDSDLYDGQGYAEVEREIAAMFGNLMGVVPARAIAYLDRVKRTYEFAFGD